MTENKKIKKFNYYKLIYAILTVIFFIFAFINIAYFSYNLIDNLVILIIEISTISIFSLVSLIEMVTKTHIKTHKIIAYVTVISIIITLNLVYLLPKNIWIFVLFITSTILICFDLTAYFIRKQKYYHTKSISNIFILIGFLIIIYIFDLFSYNYENYSFVLWAFIPCTILLATIVTLCYTIFKKLFNKACPSVLQKVGLFIICFVLCFAFSTSGVSIVNTSFTSTSQTYNSVILEKEIKMEGRNINQYILKVLVNEKQIDIDVSVDAYYEKEVGDFVLIDYNKGCLGFCYYQYSTQN